MKVLIPEKFSKDGIAVLEDAGYDVTFKPDTTPEQLLDMIPDYDALIVRSATTVTREVIEAGKKLKIIGRAGVGVDNIDREAATERGVIVCNAPLSNIVSAAEQTMAPSGIALSCSAPIMLVVSGVLGICSVITSERLHTSRMSS